MRTYQRVSKPIPDVYVQITHLFADAPDLREELGVYLPESAAQAAQRDLRVRGIQNVEPQATVDDERKKRVRYISTDDGDENENGGGVLTLTEENLWQQYLRDEIETEGEGLTFAELAAKWQDPSVRQSSSQQLSVSL